MPDDQGWSSEWDKYYEDQADWYLRGVEADEKRKKGGGGGGKAPGTCLLPVCLPFVAGVALFLIRYVRKDCS